MDRARMMRFTGFLVAFLVLSGFNLLPVFLPDTHAQDGVAAVQTQSQAIIVASDNTTVAGPLDGTKSLMTLIFTNPNDEPVRIKEIGITVAIPGEAVVWAHSPKRDIFSQRIGFTARGTGLIPLFGRELQGHEMISIDVYALMPAAPKGPVATAGSLALVEYLAASGWRVEMPMLAGRTYKVE